MMCGYVTGFEELFKSNQIDSVIKWVSGFQVFCKEIKSNAVSKLFILVWRYEGMKVLDLGYETQIYTITENCSYAFLCAFHHHWFFFTEICKFKKKTKNKRQLNKLVMRTDAFLFSKTQIGFFHFSNNKE